MRPGRPMYSTLDSGSGIDQAQTILVCDDDQAILKAVQQFLEQQNYRVLTAHNGRQAVAMVEEHPELCLLILDLMMPEMDGLSALVKIRESHNLPILVLTAKAEDQDKVWGLNLGADDYLTKPFQKAELVARVRSLIRRYTHLGAAPGGSVVHVCGGIELDEQAKSVTVDGEPVALTGSEFRILLFLMRNRGMTFSSAQLYEKVWGEKALGCENVVAVHIRHIREKIEINPREPRYLKVLWGQGYRIECPARKDQKDQ